MALQAILEVVAVPDIGGTERLFACWEGLRRLAFDQAQQGECARHCMLYTSLQWIESRSIALSIVTQSGLYSLLQQQKTFNMSHCAELDRHMENA